MIPMKRRKSRELALQALYAWQISSNNVIDIKEYILKEIIFENIDLTYFHDIFFGVIKNIKYLDKTISLYLLFNNQEIGEIDKSILRIAAYELKKRSDIPYKVVINEGIELAKKFGTNKSHKFINGILDKIKKKP